MYGRHMMVLADIAAFRVDELLDGVIIDGLDEGFADPLIREWFRGDLHAAADRLRRPRHMDDARQRFRQVDLLDPERIEGVDVAGGEGVYLVVCLEVIVMDLVEIDVAAPIAEVLAIGGLLHALEDASVAD